MSFNTLRNAIKTKLDSIPELKFVDDKHHYAIPGYPAVTFEPSGIQSEEITASDNKRTYIFTLWVHQIMLRNGRDEAIRRLLIAIDAIKNSFDPDYNLGGNADMCSPIETKVIGEYEEGNSAVKFALIEYACTLEEQVTS